MNTAATDIYDPCFTDVDVRLFRERYGMGYMTPKELGGKYHPADNNTSKADGKDGTGGKNGGLISLLYLPHGPVELSYKYMLLRPSVYIGNSWEHYRVL